MLVYFSVDFANDGAVKPNAFLLFAYGAKDRGEPQSQQDGNENFS
jgi:hypothetical protein